MPNYLVDAEYAVEGALLLAVLLFIAYKQNLRFSLLHDTQSLNSHGIRINLHAFINYLSLSELLQS